MGFSHVKTKGGGGGIKTKAQVSKNIASEVIYTTEVWHGANPKIKPFFLRLLAQYSGMRPTVKHSVCIIVCTGMVKEKGM